MKYKSLAIAGIGAMSILFGNIETQASRHLYRSLETGLRNSNSIRAARPCLSEALSPHRQHLQPNFARRFYSTSQHDDDDDTTFSEEDRLALERELKQMGMKTELDCRLSTLRIDAVSYEQNEVFFAVERAKGIKIGREIGLKEGTRQALKTLFNEGLIAKQTLDEKLAELTLKEETKSEKKD